MADVLIVHPETGGTATVPQEAFDTHYRQSGWMTPAELADWQARVAEREQDQAPPAAKGSKTSESEGK